jgi:hypothetical protein
MMGAPRYLYGGSFPPSRPIAFPKVATKKPEPTTQASMTYRIISKLLADLSSAERREVYNKLNTELMKGL